MNPVHALLSYFPNINCNIIRHFAVTFSEVFLRLGLSNENFVRISHPSLTRYSEGPCEYFFLKKRAVGYGRQGVVLQIDLKSDV